MTEGPKSKLDRVLDGLLQSPARLQSFRERIVQALREPWVQHLGSPVTLAAYLDAIGTNGAAGGDEQRVVDELGRKFLEALGYGDADRTYNEKGAAGRPDYTVRLAGGDVRAPVFVLEDKATDVRDLRKKQRGRAGEESPVDQLRRYTRSGRVRGNAGLLCNGWSVEAWQFVSDGDSCVVRLDVHALARHAVDPAGAPLPEALAIALDALFFRFSRASFEEAIAQTPTAPQPTEPWASRIREAFKESPKAGDAVVDQHYEQAWRSSALDVALDQKNLVHTLRTLIDGFTHDVRHQLDDALARAAQYEAELAHVVEQKHIAELRTALAGARPRFDLSEEDYATRVLRPVDAWLASPKPGGVSKLLASVRRELVAHVVVLDTQEAVQASIPGTAPKVIAKVSKADQEARRRASLELVDTTVRDLCNATLAGRAERARLEIESAPSIAALRAFSSWVERVSASVMVGADDDTLRAEFARQTAYVYIVRLLLVRICEDKGLFQRKLSDGGLVRWEDLSQRYLDYASGRSYEYLTQMAYECAQNVYVHFYGASQVFDWYHMDEKMLLRSIMALNAFDLEHIDTDIIGTVYGQYQPEGKHAQGRYYTPRPLVRAMLDAMDYQGGRIVGRRLGDLACGSGSFLVEACRRLLACYMGSAKEVPRDKIELALQDAQRSFFGMDVNPFACYLAETNLLIQVLDLVKRAQEEGLSFTVDRFAVYSTDSLLVNEDLTIAPDAAMGLFNKDEVAPEFAKARAREFADGFDFLVGNPPYVRADEPADHYVEYRRRLADQGWFTTRHKKWDLYVPFVQQYHRLLSDDKEARACLVTIESLATAPYAEKLRDLLTKQCTIHDLFFLEGLALFEDASWQDNIVFCFSRGTPKLDHIVERRIVRKRDSDMSLMPEPYDEVMQTERVFNKRPEFPLDRARTSRWEELCYVTVGMVLNSNDQLHDGTVVDVPSSYDPQLFGEQLIEDRGKDGKRVRHKAFTKKELLAEAKDNIHTRPTIGSRDVLRGGIGHVRWLEYGKHTRCPARVRRPTFPELYDRSKIMFGAFTGVAVDDERNLVVPHTVRISIRWCDLEDVENDTLAETRNALEEEELYDPKKSAAFSEWYLCAIALSDPIQKWLHADKRSMKDDVYPEDIKAIPVKRISLAAQQPYIDLAKERHQLWSELTALQAEGYKIGKSVGNVEIPVHALMKRFREGHPKMRHLTLAQAVAAGLFQLELFFLGQGLRGARASGATVVLQKQKVADIGAAIDRKADVAQVLAQILGALPATFAERQGIDKIPGSEQGLLDLGVWLAEQKAAVERRQRRIEEIGAEIDRLAWTLYRLKKASK